MNLRMPDDGEIYYLKRLLENFSARSFNDGGVTSHNLFGIPVNEFLEANIKCNIDIHRERLINVASLIIFDEIPMKHRYNVEAINRLLINITGVNKPFGNKSIICSGDFRQVCPVITRGSINQKINASPKFSFLWKFFKYYTLTIPQRDKMDKEYSLFVDKIGNGSLNDYFTPNESTKFNKLIELHPKLIRVNSLLNAIQFVFPKITDCKQCSECAFLSVLNDTVKEINLSCLDKLPGEQIQGLEAFEIITNNQNEILNDDYQQILLKSKTYEHLGSTPPHNLILKKGCMVYLRRNVSVQEGLMNGTKLKIVDKLNHYLKVEKISDGKPFLLPKFRFKIPSPSGINCYRLQYPVRLVYCLTFNKCQGKTLKRIVL